MPGTCLLLGRDVTRDNGEGLGVGLGPDSDWIGLDADWTETVTAEVRHGNARAVTRQLQDVCSRRKCS